MKRRLALDKLCSLLQTQPAAQVLRMVSDYEQLDDVQGVLVIFAKFEIYKYQKGRSKKESRRLKVWFATTAKSCSEMVNILIRNGIFQSECSRSK
jgi:hypothetical protein